MAIGSGGNFAYAAARALMDSDKSAEDHCPPGHGNRCRYLRPTPNGNIVVETLDGGAS